VRVELDFLLGLEIQEAPTNLQWIPHIAGPDPNLSCQPKTEFS